jgi:hypothetical protein
MWSYSLYCRIEPATLRYTDRKLTIDARRFRAVRRAVCLELATGMWILGGILSASLAAVLVWTLGSAGMRNLPDATAVPALYAMVIIAVISGFLAGAAILRRASREPRRVVLFSGLASGVAGGTIGCAFAVTMTASYLLNYATWPQDRLDQVLVVASYPVFGALGFFIGAFAGMLTGFLAGGALRVTISRPGR